MKLQKIQQTGMWFGHFYKDKAGARAFVECTEAEYLALGLKGAGKPDVPGEWICSGHYMKFDTPSGQLDDGCYADMGGVALANVAGMVGDIQLDKIAIDGTLAANAKIQ